MKQLAYFTRAYQKDLVRGEHTTEVVERVNEFLMTHRVVKVHVLSETDSSCFAIVVEYDQEETDV